MVNILRTQIMYSKSMSPLHVCVRKNNIHVLNIILAMDAKLEVFEEGSSLSPIDLAVQNGHHQLVSLFMAYGGELKHRSVLPEHMLPLHGVYQILWRTEAGKEIIGTGISTNGLNLNPLQRHCTSACNLIGVPRAKSPR